MKTHTSKTVLETHGKESVPECDLPDGVRVLPLHANCDERGSLVEFYRQERIGSAHNSIQWNHVISRPGVLRGVHVHYTHWDYLYVISGSMELALVDIRRESPGFGNCWMLELSSERPTGIALPPGVAHGFYFDDAAVLVYGLSQYWDPDDELGCRWDDPEMGIPWCMDNPPLLSPRDRTAGSFQDMVLEFESRKALLESYR